MTISNKLISLVFFIFLIGFTSCIIQNKDKANSVKKGVLDLEDWDFSEDGKVKLKGKWEFYWNQLIISDTIGNTQSYKKDYLQVPGLWNEHIIDGKKISNTGFASYRLTVKIEKIEELAIKYINAGSSSAIYIDGELLYNCGYPAKTKEKTIPGFRPEVIDFTPKSKEFEIIIEVANFHHKKGGQWEPLILGAKSDILETFYFKVFLEILSAGFILIMFLFHITVYFRFPTDKKLLYFALFALFISFRLIVDGEFSIFMLGIFNWFQVFHIAYISFYLAVLFYFLYFKSLFPRDVSTLSTRIMMLISILFTISAIVLPTGWFSFGMIYFQVFAIGSSILFFPYAIKAFKNKRDGAGTLLIGFAILFICLIHDVLEVNEIIFSTPLSSYGITVFIIMQANFLSIKIRKSLELNKELSKDLKNQNVEYLDLNERYKDQNKKLSISKEKAEQSDHLKSAFLANMSHEIRTPMNGIMGFANLLHIQDLSNEEHEECVNIIEKSGTRMLNIINDIIDISKIEAGLMETYIKDSNIDDQVQYIHTFFKPEVEAKGMKLILNNAFSPVPTIIKTDTEKVFAILTNLVKNAIKYSIEGSIEYGYQIKGEFLEFHVKDMGIGIPENRQKAVFERFIQADISNNMTQSGAGLGLSITKAYVEVLGGKIWLESEEGIGSTFYFTLPYTKPDHKESSIKDKKSKIEDFNLFKSLKILIAEDDETSKSLLLKLLKKISREIIEVGTGKEAVEACKNNLDIDLIMMDIHMPEMNGHDATKRIREFNKDVIIIAQTAFGLAGDREKTWQSGCNDYIAKPIDNVELYTLIKKHFRSR